MADVAVNEQYEGPSGAAAGLWRHEPAQGIKPCRPDTHTRTYAKLRKHVDFLGGPVVKNLPSEAGHLGSIPDWGTKMPHAVGQRSPSPKKKNTPRPAKKTGEVKTYGCINVNSLTVMLIKG